ncbi:MAG: hypothetical protein RJB37_1384, partial [Pseudomonadota bacterium]
MELFLSPHLNPNPRPSAWIRRHAGLIPNLDNGASVLDLACGSGRHVRWLAARGAQVTAVDDIENGPWPLPGRTFDAIVVTNYLWRPLLPAIVASVAPGGVLLYETFAHGNASVGKPSRPDFLLQPGELLDRVRPELRVVAY